MQLAREFPGLLRNEKTAAGARKEAESLVDEVRLLSARELQELFPDATLRRERFYGLTKSLVAIGGFPKAKTSV